MTIESTRAGVARRRERRGSRTTATYTLERKGGILSCSCPASRNQPTPTTERTCKRRRGYLGEASERARTGATGSVVRIAPRPWWVPKVREDREVRDRRRAALKAALECFPVAYDKMMNAYGLRMPKHLAYAMGFWNGLTRAERDEAWGYIGTGPCGVSGYFEEGGLEMVVKPGLDERLDYRYRCDPPEMVTVFGGNSDGSHWGLWYDDPAELPRVICHNWAPSAETGSRSRRCSARFATGCMASTTSRSTPSTTTLAGSSTGSTNAMRRRCTRITRKRSRRFWNDRTRAVGSDRGFRDGRRRSISAAGTIVTRVSAEDPAVAEWIARARSELAANRPGMALVIGRDLHWQDNDETREVCTELLVGGYRALGRDAIAEIVRVHHQHRDLGSVAVYEEQPREPTPFERAMSERDKAAVAAILSDAPDPKKLVTAMAVSDLDVELVEIMVPHATPSMIEDAQLSHVEQVEFWQPRPDTDFSELRGQYRRAALYLFERCGVGARVLEAALRCKDDEVIAKAFAKADLAWRSERGRSVLHVLCRMGHVDGVRALLDRGADVKLVDLDGETPYDAVRHAWAEHREAAAEVYELLRARGGAPPPKEAAAELVPDGTWEVGTRVVHAKFGEGVVTAATGRGDDAKLTIEFGSDAPKSESIGIADIGDAEAKKAKEKAKGRKQSRRRRRQRRRCSRSS